MQSSAEPIGVILAGGLGRRIGGSKALVQLHGAPLISYPLAVLRACLSDLAVIAKPATELPNLEGVAVWREPDQPQHPLAGIVHALARADPRPVLVCAADMPFLTSKLVRLILAADPGDAPAVIPTQDGALQPLLALYTPTARALLERALVARSSEPLRAVVAGLRPRLLEVDERRAFFNVNTHDDLRRAALRGGARP